MKKRWVTLIGLTVALATAAAISAFTLTGGGGDNNDGLKHVPVETTHGDPIYEEWLSDIGSSQGLVTSIDDIDPNQCNLVHNINACGPDQIGFIEVGEPEPGICCKPTVSPAVKAQNTATIDRSEEEGEPEPLFVDGEPGYVVQSLTEADEIDCGLAGGAVYVTSEGEVGCVAVHDLEDSSEDLVSPSQPPVVEPQPVAAPG